MNTDAIDKAFATLISERGVHKKLGNTSNDVKQLRYKMKNGIYISTDLKLRLLQKSGWTQDEASFTRADLVGLLKFYDKSSQRTKDHGYAYVIEKWEVAK